jgi:hypothetical protein
MTPSLQARAHSLPGLEPQVTSLSAKFAAPGASDEAVDPQWMNAVCPAATRIFAGEYQAGWLSGKVGR